MEVDSFADIAEPFNDRVNRLVWCTVTTIDRKGRPRSRILHPVWEGSTGWIATGRTSLKSKHIAENPYVSVTYFDLPAGNPPRPAADLRRVQGRVGRRPRREAARLGPHQERTPARRLRPRHVLPVGR